MKLSHLMLVVGVNGILTLIGYEFVNFLILDFPQVPLLGSDTPELMNLVYHLLLPLIPLVP